MLVKYKIYLFSQEKKAKNLAFLVIVILLTITHAGCKKFVQEAPPITQLVTANVFNNSGAATSALTNIYQEMYSNQESYNMASSTGLLADELINYSTSILANIQYYTNSMTAAPLTFGPWDNAYNYIYQANAIIEGLQNNAAISPSIDRQLTGESKFIRAFWHFYLSNCYGDIPLVTTSNYKVNASIARTPQSQVYQQIIADLKDAQNSMNSDFVDASDTTTTSDRVRPNKWAAAALLARVYLYTGKYDSAELEATQVINNGALFNLVADLDSVFLTNSTEAIWQLGTPLPNTWNTSDGQAFILQGTPGDGSGQLYSLNKVLMNAFELGDHRSTHWVGSYIAASPVDTFYFPYKYKSYGSTTITEYTMILRLAEQYLIRAEARVQQANTGGGIDDLNRIRQRARLSAYSGATDKTSLLTAILHERQVELFTEWGHRWFDLIRTGTVNSIMGAPGNVSQSKGGSWNSNDGLFPIPQSERNIDPNLTQNAGY